MTSGTRWTEEQMRAAGWARINARVKSEVVEALRELAVARGESQSAVLTDLVLAAKKKSTKRSQRVRRRTALRGKSR